MSSVNIASIDHYWSLFTIIISYHCWLVHLLSILLNISHFISSIKIYSLMSLELTSAQVVSTSSSLWTLTLNNVIIESQSHIRFFLSTWRPLPLLKLIESWPINIMRHVSKNLSGSWTISQQLCTSCAPT